MVDIAAIGWGEFFWILAAFTLTMWLIASAMTGFEKNRLFPYERVLRAVIGIAVLLPNMAIAMPAFAAGVGLVVLHRFLGGEPSPIDRPHPTPTS